MLNFADQTGCGALTVIWTIVAVKRKNKYINAAIAFVALSADA